MKRAVIFGASGLVGGALLDILLSSGDYGEVVAIGRRPLDLHHPKLKQEIIDMDQLDACSFQADHIFCTLGTTMKKAGSKEVFRKVDLAYPLAAARWGLANGAQLFAVVTSLGSDINSLFFYSKVKGELETSLKKLNYASLGIFRPSMLLGNRQETRLAENISQKVMQGLNFLIPQNYKAIPAEKVAQAMYDLAKAEKPGITEVNSGQMWS